MAPEEYINSLRKRYKLKSQPFQGGFEDFLEPTPYSKDVCSNTFRLPKTSVLEDLVSYWGGETPHSFKADQPTLLSLAYFPLRIVAGEWMVYAHTWSTNIKPYEYSTNIAAGTTSLDKLDADLRTLQSYGRSHIQSMLKLRYIIGAVQSHNASEPSPESYTAIVEDYEDISAVMKMYYNRLESMIPVVTSMVQIADTRRSLKEAENVTRLTILALLFIPLSFVAGLFSMNSEVSAAGLKLYFSVAIPLCILVFAVSRLLPFLNMDAFWSIVRGTKKSWRDSNW
jgi:CorA-like Mg2+ transporter protein